MIIYFNNNSLIIVSGTRRWVRGGDYPFSKLHRKYMENITYSSVYRKKAIKEKYYSVRQLKDSEHDRVTQITVDVRVIIRAS